MDIHELISAITDYFPRLIAALPVVAGIILGTILLNLAVNRGLMIIARRTSFAEADIVPFTRLTSWAFRFVALVLILGVFGFEIGGLWAMISTILGLIAIGFVAVWSLLSNISSTALIVIMSPFEIGDDVEFAGESVQGRVVNLNFFFTTLLMHDGRYVQIPNNQFFQKVLKRTRNERTISLAAQLNLHANAALPPPPPPPPPADAAKAPAPDANASAPDPRSMNLPGQRR
jgi:small-conductance mechanosensitive channel